MNSNFINNLDSQISLLENEKKTHHWNSDSYLEIHQAIFSAKRLKEYFQGKMNITQDDNFNEKKLRKKFKNSSDCYADTNSIDASGNFKEGDVIQAITEDAFIKLLKDVKVIQ